MTADERVVSNFMDYDYGFTATTISLGPEITAESPAESPVQEGQKGGKWWDFRNRG
mgnify:CR=1 FL=1